MKKLLTLTLLFLLPLLAKAYDVQIDGIYYLLNGDSKTATVTFENDSYNSYSGSVNIPEKFTYKDIEYTVTCIGERAFQSCKNLTFVAIPQTVISIEDRAFWACSTLNSLSMPNSLTTIGGYAFIYCYGLLSINIPNSVTSIGDGAFSNCSGLDSIKVESGSTYYDSREDCNAIIETRTNTLIAGCKKTTIPNTVTAIGNDAFDGCYGLTSIIIPNTVTSIGNYAFDDCYGLTSVFIPKSVTSIGSGAFRECRGLISFKVENGNTKYDSRENCNAIIETTTNTLIAGCENTVIPNTVTVIGDYAFEGCGLTSINIPSSVTAIGSEAFAYCLSLTSVTIPNSVTSIGANAFLRSGLATFNIPNSVTSIGSDAFRYTEWYRNQEYGVLYHDNWLLGCRVDKPTGDLIIPDGTRGVEDLSFYGCSELTSVVIPNSVINIGQWSFFNCSGMTTVTIGKNVKSIGERAFWGCTGLIKIVSWIEDPFEYGKDAWYQVKKIPLYVPYGSKSKYESTGWGWRFNIVEMGTSSGIAIDEVNFPDENFRNWVLAQNCGADGILTDEEIAAFTGGLYLSDLNITDLKGIEFFTELTGLACFSNQLTSLDVSNNTALTSLSCFSNQLTSLNVSGCTALTSLGCGWNQLTSLDVSKNTALTSLSCPGNLLTSIDVSKNTALTELFCGFNLLTSLNVSNNTALKNLYCHGNQIKGTAMDALIAGLPSTGGRFFAINPEDESEQNVVTKAQVAAAKEKGWTTYYWSSESNSWLEYEGSDPVLNKITVNANGGQVYYNKEEIDNTIETFDIEEGLNRLFFPTDTILKITVNGEDVTSQLTLMDAVITSVDEFGRTRDKRIADVPSLLITPTGQNLQVDIEFVGDRQVIQEDGILYVIDGSEAYVAGATDCPENLVLPSSVTNEGKSYKIIGLIPKCFSYWKELKSVSLPESLKYVTVGAFFVCENLENVEISSNVEYIGEFAFYYNKIKTIKVFAKDPIKCFGFDNDVFNSVLYVPKGCKTKYENADFWKYFKTIVEMGIVPVDEGQTIDIGNEITENTDLDGNVVGNIYYSISSGDGSYNPTEGCLVLTKPTNDLAINLYDIFSEYFKEQFNGLAFKLAPGKGSIKVEAETQGHMVLKVKIGNNDPIEMELDGKLKVKFPYNVSEETLVYIYGGMSTAGAKATGGTRASADADLLKIYGFEIVSDASGIEATESGLPANADAPVYNLNGQRVDTPTKGIYIKNGRKVLVK